MSHKIIQARLKTYNCQSQEEEEHAIKEILQEIILAALSRSDFFSHAAFQGGTALRIFYNLRRFSEDLNFALIHPNSQFELAKYLPKIRNECEIYGCHLELQDRSKADSAVKKAFLKEDSLGKVLELSFAKKLSRGQKLSIKLEVDTNPPSGARIEGKFYDFPVPFAVNMHDLGSLFAGKTHALLCRGYEKGRDWFDFLWYTQQRIVINFEFLQAALLQSGHLPTGQVVDQAWYLEAMTKRIQSADWKKIVVDVAPFLRPEQRASLALWGPALFLDRLAVRPERR